MSREDAEPRPWYRQPWPWLLMVPPAGAVVGGVAMVILAVNMPADLVVADYSRIEELTHERFARDARAAEIGATANAADGRAVVAVTLGPGIAPVPPALQLALQHAARQSADVTVTLARVGANVYSAYFELATGRYDLELSPPDGSWRLAGSLAGLPQTIALRTQPLEARR
jgi:hypothetical protein